ncbi:NADH dehydrogenase [Candidatus Thorarchaeota archaeon]|nr:MAG: NADH dehydrogenase [Candidatus Thorarchaeota archaeon]
MEATFTVTSPVPLIILGIPAGIAVFGVGIARLSRLQETFKQIEKPSLLLGTGLTLLLLIYHAPILFTGAVYEFSLLSMRLESTNIAPSIATALIFFLTSIYNIKAEKGGRLKPEVYNFFVLMFLICMLGLMLVYDIFAVALFIELVIAVSVVMVLHAKGKEAVEASFKYLIITAISALFVILGTMLIYITTQASNIDEILANPGPLADSPTVVVIVAICFIAGLGADIGIAPFHGWLPDAFPASKPAVNCFFAAEPIALFIALHRLIQTLYTVSPSVVLPILVTSVGAFSLIFGASMAYAQKNFMRMVAYATIEEFGYIMIIFGVLTPFSYAVGQLYLMNVSIMKLGILLTLGSVLISTGTMDMPSLGGLGKRMKLTSAAYLISILSLAGIAPLSGFFTKWFLFEAIYQHLLTNVGIMLAASVVLVLMITSLFAFVFLIRSFHTIFTGTLKDALKDVRETPKEMWIPAIITACIIIVFGLIPHLFLAFII